MSNIPKFCPRCGKPLEIRKGTYGNYLDCTGYPKCKYTIELSSKVVIETSKSSKTVPVSCPKCGKKLALYIGKYGIFLGCNGYPNCDYSYNFVDQTNIPCPKCGKKMRKRTGTYGLFYGCSAYPDCKFTFNLRVKGKNKKKIPKKSLVLPEGYSFNISGTDIVEVISNEGQTLRNLADKLKLTEEADVRYLKLKLKEFERKGLVVKYSIDNENFWKNK